MIGLGLYHRQILQQRVACVCSVCRQERDEEKTREKDVEVVVYGVKAYAVCCCCRLEVPDPKDRNYRCRWRRWVAKHPSRRRS